MKIIGTAILCFICTLSIAQSKYDTISFNTILLNNKSLYTKFKYLKSITNDKDNRARVYTSKDIIIPFITFNDDEIIYDISSDNVVYSYSESKPDDIFITYVKPNSNFKIKLGKNILLKRNVSASSLRKIYVNSYKIYKADPDKNLRLVVKKDNKYAFLDLIFKDGHFQELYLTSE
jgi:hypothetical protein